MATKSKLICITGIDGAGKSTLVELLAKELPSVQVANIWDLMDGDMPSAPFNSKRDIDTYLCELTPDARLLFLAHALKYALDKAWEAGKDIVLFNAYFYKYFASELALGASMELVQYLINIFPKPDKVVMLDIPVPLASKRKSLFSRYECGLTRHTGEAAFVEFQSLAQLQWTNFDQSSFVRLDAAERVEHLLDKTLDIIK